MNKMMLGSTVLLFALGLLIPQPGPGSAAAQAGTSVSGAVYAGETSGTTEPAPASSGFDRQVEAWIHALGRQEGFEAWLDAAWTSSPLGPGLHGWVIHLQADAQDVGYLIVGATPDGGYTLQEYGLGEYPLFSLNTLHQAMVQQGLISNMTGPEFAETIGADAERIYINALHAVWKVSHRGNHLYFDAKTGEFLPLDDAKLTEVRDEAPPSPGSGQAESIVDTAYVPVFDPFYRVNWITQKPMALADHQEFRLALHHETEITYSARLFQRTMLCAYAVVGYQEWNDGRGFAALDQWGERFIPYDTLAALGSFYQ